MTLTRAVVSIDRHDLDQGVWARKRDKRDSMPAADFEDANQGEVKIWEFEGEKFGGEARAEKWSFGPWWRKTTGVVRMEMGEKVSLASLCPAIHRYQTIIHLTMDCGVVVVEVGYCLKGKTRRAVEQEAKGGEWVSVRS